LTGKTVSIPLRGYVVCNVWALLIMLVGGIVVAIPLRG
jgi:hypothetical protein